MSKEASYVLSVATVRIASIFRDSGVLYSPQEEFIKRMVQAGHRQAAVSRRSVINFVDMGQRGVPCAHPFR